MPELICNVLSIVLTHNSLNSSCHACNAALSFVAVNCVNPDGSM